MPPFLPLLLVAFATLAISVAGAEELEFAPAHNPWEITAGEYQEDDDAWILHTDPPSVKTGPGFRQFARLHVGGFTSKEEAVNDFKQPATNSTAGFIESSGIDWERGVFYLDYNQGNSMLNEPSGIDPVGSEIQPFYTSADELNQALSMPYYEAIEQVTRLNSLEFSDITALDLEFESDLIQRQVSLSSIELMGQHIWDRHGEIQNRTPAWRLNYYGAGLAVELGNLPVAEQAPLSQDLSPKKDNWLSGFKYANYFAYGIRLNYGTDGYLFDGNLNLAGRIYADTTAEHFIIGPQIAIGRVASRGRWMFDGSAHLQLGYGHTELEQMSGVGEGPLPGRLNNTAVAQSTFNKHEQDRARFAQLAELRFTTSYLFKPNLSLDLTARGFVVGPWYESQDLVDYRLPDFGLRNTESNKYLTGANLYLGVTYLR